MDLILLKILKIAEVNHFLKCYVSDRHKDILLPHGEKVELICTWLFKCFLCGRGAGDSGILQEGDRGTGGLWILKSLYFKNSSLLNLESFSYTIKSLIVERHCTGREDLNYKDQ